MRLDKQTGNAQCHARAGQFERLLAATIGRIRTTTRTLKRMRGALDNIGRMLPKGFLLPVPVLTGVTFGAPVPLLPDADKERYPQYLAWVEQNLRVGGLLLADNVFRTPREREGAAEIHAFNTHLADSGRWRATLLPVEDGLAVAVRTDA